MPAGQLGAYRGNPRQRGNSAAFNAAVKLAKEAVKMKRNYDKKKAANKPNKPRARRGRPPGSKNKPKMSGRLKAGVAATYTNIIPYEKADKMKKMFPETIYQKYYVTSQDAYIDLNPGVNGTITNTDLIYSTPPSSWENASIMIFNIHNTEAQGLPQSDTGNTGYRSGNQLVGAAKEGQTYGTDTNLNDAFIWQSNATSTNIGSRISPFYQSAIPETALDAYTLLQTGNTGVPRLANSVLKSVEWDFHIHNPGISRVRMGLKLVKYDNGAASPLQPGSLGPTVLEGGELLNSLCNHAVRTDNTKFKTLYTKSWIMEGLKLNGKLKTYHIKGKKTLNFLRSQYRRQWNANNIATLGTQSTTSLTLADDFSFFNSTFLVLSCSAIDDRYIASVTVEKGTPGGGQPEYFENLPQVTQGFPVGIPATVEEGKYDTIGPCQFAIGGSVKIFRGVRDLKRVISGSVATELNALKSQVADMNDLKNEVAFLKAKDKYNESGGKHEKDKADYSTLSCHPELSPDNASSS